MFSEVGAGTDTRSTRAVLFVDLGDEIEVGVAGLGNSKVGGCGGSLGDGLVFVCGLIVKGEVSGGA